MKFFKNKFINIYVKLSNIFGIILFILNWSQIQTLFAFENKVIMYLPIYIFSGLLFNFDSSWKNFLSISRCHPHSVPHNPKTPKRLPRNICGRANNTLFHSFNRFHLWAANNTNTGKSVWKVRLSACPFVCPSVGQSVSQFQLQLQHHHQHRPLNPTETATPTPDTILTSSRRPNGQLSLARVGNVANSIWARARARASARLGNVPTKQVVCGSTSDRGPAPSRDASEPRAKPLMLPDAEVLQLRAWPRAMGHRHFAFGRAGLASLIFNTQY